MKKKILFLSLFICACAVPAWAQLTLVSNPPPHAMGRLSESQFDAIVAAGPALAPGKAATDVAGYSLFGHNLSIRYAKVSGVTLSEQVTLTDAQFAAILAAGPPLPSGETAARVRSANATRMLQGGTILLSVQFSS